MIKVKEKTHLFDGGVIKIDPYLELAVEHEGRIVFAIVAHQADQLQFDLDVLHHGMENLSLLVGSKSNDMKIMHSFIKVHSSSDLWIEWCRLRSEEEL